MASPDEQSGRTTDSEPTRNRLLRAAAELIAELGFGRVTTRAVAERAGLPHGAVSYHFRGKRELLTEAALATIEQAFPREELEQLPSVADVVRLTAARVSDLDRVDPVLSDLAIETMLEARRDPVLRERMATLTREFRRVLGNLVRYEQDSGTLIAGVAPDALATLILTAGDGLFLNAMIDPELDVTGALEALLSLATPAREDPNL
jgi:AcrR family transcriptional regulator